MGSTRRRRCDAASSRKLKRLEATSSTLRSLRRAESTEIFVPTCSAGQSLLKTLIVHRRTVGSIGLLWPKPLCSGVLVAVSVRLWGGLGFGAKRQAEPWILSGRAHFSNNLAYYLASPRRRGPMQPGRDPAHNNRRTGGEEDFAQADPADP